VPKGGVALFSLEMSADQLATRLLAEESRISGDRIRRGEISQRDFDRFLEVSRELASLPLNIDDTPAISISALRTRCRRLQRTKGLDLIVVDYLQLMRPAAGTRPESRVLEISMITQGLKALAKELSVPVIALLSCRAPWKAAKTSAPSFRIYENQARSNRMPMWSCSSIVTNII
jgi:replicative DNA helicase